MLAAYNIAKERYAALGINTDRAVRAVLRVPISVQCWQADDVRGLEAAAGALDSGGLQATGNYPGAARTGDEIRQDFDQASLWIPGAVRFNIHAMYAETGGKRVDRDALEPRHFSRWVDWAKRRKIGLDFNPTCFAHPMVRDGLTLSSPSKPVREFWIRHCLACRKVARSIAARLGDCVNNIWIPDGRKDTTVDRWGPRERLVAALDEILDRKMKGVVDSVESKLFGIGCEDYTVGSHEFYLAYAATRGVVVCFDMGHFHPTESVADKVSSALQFVDRLLIHVSRGVRWDSDHVVLATDEVNALCDEAVRGKALDRIYWAMDYFDASINRVGAWVIGARALRKALLRAMLEPWDLHRRAEHDGRGADKLALLERRNEMPLGAVWDYACHQAAVPAGLSWLSDLASYEKRVLSRR
ncbi:MAG: L-rhamnose isomerase [Armatimonadota bacterium]|nr:MAG: L-rhamnose isomerase [Armatimonadota bacterium]